MMATQIVIDTRVVQEERTFNNVLVTFLLSRVVSLLMFVFSDDVISYLK